MTALDLYDLSRKPPCEIGPDDILELQAAACTLAWLFIPKPEVTRSSDEPNSRILGFVVPEPDHGQVPNGDYERAWDYMLRLLNLPFNENTRRIP